MNEASKMAGQCIGGGIGLQEAQDNTKWLQQTVAEMIQEEEKRAHTRLGELESLRVKLGSSVLRLTRQEFNLLGRIL